MKLIFTEYLELDMVRIFTPSAPSIDVFLILFSDSFHLLCTHTLQFAYKSLKSQQQALRTE